MSTPAILDILVARCEQLLLLLTGSPGTPLEQAAAEEAIELLLHIEGYLKGAAVRQPLPLDEDIRQLKHRSQAMAYIQDVLDALHGAGLLPGDLG